MKAFANGRALLLVVALLTVSGGAFAQGRRVQYYTPGTTYYYAPPSYYYYPSSYPSSSYSYGAGYDPYNPLAPYHRLESDLLKYEQRRSQLELELRYQRRILDSLPTYR